MYSVILMAALSASDMQPSGILFNRAGGGCSGQSAALFAGRGQRQGILYRLRHRQRAGAGCSGGGAQAFYESSYRSTYRSGYAIAAPGYYGWKQMPQAPVGSVQAAFKVGQRVRHPAGQTFPAGTGVIFNYAPIRGTAEVGYQVRCDQTGKILPGVFRESDLSPEPDPSTAPVPPSIPAEPTQNPQARKRKVENIWAAYNGRRR